MPLTLTIQIPDDLAPRFLALADQQFRAAEQQALWLIKLAVEDGERGETRSRRLRTDAEKARDLAPLAAELRRLHAAAGAPSYRAVAAEVSDAGQHVSHATVYAVLGGKQLSSWQRTEALAAVLGGDIEAVRPLWVRAAGLAEPARPDPSRPATG